MKRTEQISLQETVVEAVEQGFFQLRGALNKSLQDARDMKEDYDRLMAQHDRLLDEHRVVKIRYESLTRAYDELAAEKIDAEEAGQAEQALADIHRVFGNGPDGPIYDNSY